MSERVFGRVDEHAGELAATIFWRLWFLPLIPRQSVWVIPEPGGPRVVQTRWHPRSILAAYARTWCPIVAGLCVLDDRVASFIAAAIAIAVCAGTWIWRTLPGARSQLRSDLGLVALGMRCEPQWMTLATRSEVLARVTREWQALGPTRSPEDVARFGSASADELIRAYGVLVMHAATERADGAKLARDAALRIFEGRHDLAEPEGVFRSISAPRPVLGRAQLREIVATRAALAGHARVLAAARAPTSFVHEVIRNKGYLLLAVGVASGLAMLDAVRDPNTLDFVALPYLTRTIGTQTPDVRVSCDSIERHIETRPDSAWLCRIGDRVLPMIGLAEPPPGRVVYGTLVPRVPFRPREPWDQLLHRDDRVDMRTYEVALDTTLRSKLGQIVLGSTVLASSLGLLVLWYLQRRHRQRMLLAAERAFGARP